MLSIHAYEVRILVDTLIPEVDHDRLHGWAASDFNCLMLVHRRVSLLPWAMIAKAGSILDVEAKKWSKVIEVGANHAGTSVAVALSSQTQSTYMSSCLSISMHDFLIADVVSDEVTAASYDLNRFHLSFKDIWRSKVHIANYWSKLDSHFDQLGLFRL